MYPHMPFSNICHAGRAVCRQVASLIISSPSLNATYHMRMRARTRAHIRPHTCTYMCTHRHAHAHACTGTHPCAHMNERTHAHTRNVHVHTHVLLQTMISHSVLGRIGESLKNQAHQCAHAACTLQMDRCTDGRMHERTSSTPRLWTSHFDITSSTDCIAHLHARTHAAYARTHACMHERMHSHTHARTHRPR